MGFILDSLANIIIEAIDTLVLWVCNLGVTFRLDIGNEGSVFSQVFPETISGQAKNGVNTISISDFSVAIGALAVMCLLLATVFKIYQLFLNPYAKSESAGEIVLKFMLSLSGIIMAYPIFRYIQAGFNRAYESFMTPYMRITGIFKAKDFLAKKKAQEALEAVAGSNGTLILDEHGQNPTSEAASKVANSGDAFVLGSDKLLPTEDGLVQHPFALALVEIFFGIALMMGLLKLLFEVYERYVILAILYLFSPLAFMSLITKGGEVFKAYWWMVFCQFILMCSNLLFLTLFMVAWYNIIQNGVNINAGTGEQKYFFENSSDLVLKFLLMISLLVVGQKFDELLKGLGLNAATTGQGIMGAALGSVIVARAALGGAASGVGWTGKALTGQTGTQRAIAAGIRSEGREGGLVGKGAWALESMKSSGSEKAALPTYEGNTFNEGYNNMVKGTGDKNGLKAPELGDQKSDIRQNFDAASLKWEDKSNFTGDPADKGINVAYDKATNTTHEVATTEAANQRMQALHEGKIGQIHNKESGFTHKAHITSGKADFMTKGHNGNK